MYLSLKIVLISIKRSSSNTVQLLMAMYINLCFVQQMALLANLMANKYQPSSESNIIANEEKDDVEDKSIVYPREPLVPVDTSADKYKSNKSSYNSTKFEEEPDLPKRPTLSSVPLLHTPEMPELTTKLPPFDMYKQIDKENTSPSNKGPSDLTLCSRSVYLLYKPLI